MSSRPCLIILIDKFVKYEVELIQLYMPLSSVYSVFRHTALGKTGIESLGSLTFCIITLSISGNRGHSMSSL